MAQRAPSQFLADYREFLVKRVHSGDYTPALGVGLLRAVFEEQEAAGHVTTEDRAAFGWELICLAPHMDAASESLQNGAMEEAVQRTLELSRQFYAEFIADGAAKKETVGGAPSSRATKRPVSASRATKRPVSAPKVRADGPAPTRPLVHLSPSQRRLAQAIEKDPDHTFTWHPHTITSLLRYKVVRQKRVEGGGVRRFLTEFGKQLLAKPGPKKRKPKQAEDGSASESMSESQDGAAASTAPLSSKQAKPKAKTSSIAPAPNPKDANPVAARPKTKGAPIATSDDAKKGTAGAGATKKVTATTKSTNSPSTSIGGRGPQAASVSAGGGEDDDDNSFEDPGLGDESGEDLWSSDNDDADASDDNAADDDGGEKVSHTDLFSAPE